MFGEVLCDVFGGQVRFGGGEELTSTYKVEGSVCCPETTNT